MATFSGRTRDDVPLTGHLSRADIATFMAGCVRDEWKRVAVGEGMDMILAAYSGGGELWLHPNLRGVA